MESKANGLMTLMDNGTALVSHDAKVRQNADAQLAIAQNENLKKEVEQHSRKVTTAVSSSIANTRQVRILQLPWWGTRCVEKWGSRQYCVKDSLCKGALSHNATC
jgi:hypothetical protein